MKALEWVQVSLHSFLTAALDGGEWLTSGPSRFTPGEEPGYRFNRKLGYPQSRSERLGEEKNVFNLPGFQPRTVQPVA